MDKERAVVAVVLAARQSLLQLLVVNSRKQRSLVVGSRLHMLAAPLAVNLPCLAGLAFSYTNEPLKVKREHEPIRHLLSLRNTLAKRAIDCLWYLDVVGTNALRSNLQLTDSDT
jgi:hypothetical protein